MVIYGLYIRVNKWQYMLTTAEHFVRFPSLAINDSGTVRRINEVYVNDGGSLEGPFTIFHTTMEHTTSISTISGLQLTTFNTTTTFDTNRSTVTTTVFDNYYF